MSQFEDIKLYLPKYLSSDSEKTLFEELSSFPKNIDSRLYTSSLKEANTFFQGDGVEGLLFVNFPDLKISKIPAMILSNTCDINSQNIRLFPSNIVYSPILNFEKYKNALLEKGINQQKIEDHIAALKRQEISSVFYLPQGDSLKSDSLVFFDRINSCSSSYLDLDQEEKGSPKLFTLSDYGYYLFLLKLSIHFTRIREGVDRGKGTYK